MTSKQHHDDPAASPVIATGSPAAASPRSLETTMDHPDCATPIDRYLPPPFTLSPPLLSRLTHHASNRLCTVHRRLGLVYGVCCLLGLSTLLPWNVFITEKQFFNVRVQQPPTQPALADNFENIIVVAFQIMCAS